MFCYALLKEAVTYLWGIPHWDTSKSHEPNLAHDHAADGRVRPRKVGVGSSIPSLATTLKT